MSAPPWETEEEALTRMRARLEEARADRFARDFVWPKEEPGYRAAYEVWLEYETRCEAFDRATCSGPVLHGSVMPATGYQRATSATYARNLRTRVVDRIGMVDRGVSEAARRAALRDHERGARASTEYLVAPRERQPMPARRLWACSHRKIRCGTCREFRAKAHAWLFRAMVVRNVTLVSALCDMGGVDGPVRGRR